MNRHLALGWPANRTEKSAMANATESRPVKSAVSRATGTHVEVWRADDFGLDPENGGPWLTICEHGSNVQHATRAVALDWSAAPDVWCGQCRDAGLAEQDDE